MTPTFHTIEDAAYNQKFKENKTIPAGSSCHRALPEKAFSDDRGMAQSERK
jgi:hypothetical protein